MLKDQAQALMLISVDNYDTANPLDWYGKALEMVGLAGDPISDEERNAINASADAFAMSDIERAALRIPIPLTDMLLPIHQTGYQYHHNLGVTTQEVATTTGTSINTADPANIIQKNVFRPGSNQVQLQFEMKNNLRKVSVLADLFAQQSVSMGSRSVMVAFFSPTLCIFKSRLVGVNRAAVQGSDKEILTISLELPTGDEEKELAQARKETKPANVQKPLPADQAGPPAPQAMATVVLPEELADVRDGYLFYRIGSLFDFEKINVTDFDSRETVQRRGYRIFRVVSESINRPVRNMIGVEYNGEIVTMQDTKASAYKGRIGLIRVAGVIYLAVQS